MSGPSLEPLSRFTPDAGRLDRDALLFAAGRASARPGRRWRAVATLLAATQTLSLWTLLRPSPALPNGGPASSLPVVRSPEHPDATSSTGLWSVRHGRLKTETAGRGDGDVNFIESGPPLRAFAFPRRS